MAKYLAQIIITGAQVVGRAFARAVKQEITASQAAAAARQKDTGGSTGSHGAASDAITGITVQEAKQILNIEDIQDHEKTQKNYDHLFSVNERAKGGSFYIQSKVVRAKERIDHELESMGIQQEKQDPPKQEKS